MPTTHTPDSTEGKLAELDLEEKALSARRGDLHREIDGLYLEVPLGAVRSTRLDLLENQERGISAERQTLHTQINVLRSTIGLPPVRRLELDTAA